MQGNPPSANLTEEAFLSSGIPAPPSLEKRRESRLVDGSVESSKGLARYLCMVGDQRLALLLLSYYASPHHCINSSIMALFLPSFNRGQTESCLYLPKGTQ